jgi:integrase
MTRPKGTGCIYPRSGTSVWWIKYSRNGKPFSESSHTTDKRKAERILKQRLAEIQTGTFVGPETERTRVHELADDFLRDYRINGRKSVDDAKARWTLHLQPFFGPLRAVEVNCSLVTRYIESRQQQGAKNATINRELAALKRMFNLGREHRKVRDVPIFPRLKENNVRKGFLEDGQYHKLVEYCPELWFRALLEVGRTYGWRISELLKMRVRQTDMFSRTIRLEPGTTKNDDGREVTMTDSVYTLLAECLTGKSAEDYVFTRVNGKPVRDFRSTWVNACQHAGVPGLLFHDLRRTAARNLRRAGIAEGVIMKIGGWRTRSVFERYAIVDQNDIAAAVKKLEASEQKAGNSYSSATVEEEPAPVAPVQTVN